MNTGLLVFMIVAAAATGIAFIIDANKKQNNIDKNKEALAKNENAKSITFVEVMFYIFAGLSLIYGLVYGIKDTYKYTLTSEFFIGLISMVVNIFFGNLIMWLRKIYNKL